MPHKAKVGGAQTERTTHGRGQPGGGRNASSTPWGQATRPDGSVGRCDHRQKAIRRVGGAQVSCSTAGTRTPTEVARGPPLEPMASIRPRATLPATASAHARRAPRGHQPPLLRNACKRTTTPSSRRGHNNWSKSSQRWSMSGRTPPNPIEFGATGSTSTPCRPNLARARPILPKFGGVRANIGPARPKLKDSGQSWPDAAWKSNRRVITPDPIRSPSIRAIQTSTDRITPPRLPDFASLAPHTTLTKPRAEVRREYLEVVRVEVRGALLAEDLERAGQVTMLRDKRCNARTQDILGDFKQASLTLRRFEP